MKAGALELVKALDSLAVKSVIPLGNVDRFNII